MPIKRPRTELCPNTLPLPFEPLTIRIPVAVRLTGIGRSKLYELSKSGDVKTVKFGTATLVKVANLRRLVQQGWCDAAEHTDGIPVHPKADNLG